MALVLTLGVAVATIATLARRNQDLRRRNALAVYEAEHDPLTGLPNRVVALAELERQATRMAKPARTPATPVAGERSPLSDAAPVGLLDLDDFKSVNDRYGHHVGDELLARIAHRLREAIQESGLVARLAGDEFLILWTGRPVHVQTSACTLLERLTADLDVDGVLLQPAASLGIAYIRAGWTPAQVLRAADAAMYVAKQQTRPLERRYGFALHSGEQPPISDRRSPRRH